MSRFETDFYKAAVSAAEAIGTIALQFSLIHALVIAMAEEWIVRVQGKEYGPVDFETLSEWKREGRVLPTNEVRKVDVDLWTTASQIPDLFPPVQASAIGDEIAQTRSLHDILVETWRIYGKGFWQFLALSALVAVPSICAQLSSTALGSPSNLELDLRTFLAASFNLTMLLLSLAAWPLYIAGIQILTSELAAGRSIAVVDLVQRALRFWPRVAALWVFVALSYFFWTVLPIAVILVVAVGSPSLFSIFFALVVLAFQVWMTGRLFVNFMFWQQFAVLAGSDFTSALRQSKELARSRRDLPWFRRPLWRGVFLASLWFALVLVLNAGPEWSAMQHYFQVLATTQDPQKLLQSLNASSPGFDLTRFAFALVQAVLRPLLGIAFVLLYFNSSRSAVEG